MLLVKSDFHWSVVRAEMRNNKNVASRSSANLWRDYVHCPPYPQVVSNRRSQSLVYCLGSTWEFEITKQSVKLIKNKIKYHITLALSPSVRPPDRQIDAVCPSFIHCRPSPAFLPVHSHFTFVRLFIVFNRLIDLGQCDERLPRAMEPSSITDTFKKAISVGEIIYSERSL